MSFLFSRGNATSADTGIAPSSAAAGFQASSGETVPDAAVNVNGDGDLEDPVDERLLIDRMNVEGSYAFQVHHRLFKR